MWGYLVSATAVVVAALVTLVSSTGGWESREIRALDRLVEIDKRLPLGHPAKERLQRHIDDRVQLLANRALEGPIPEIDVLLIGSMGVIGASVVLSTFGLSDETWPSGEHLKRVLLALLAMALAIAALVRLVARRRLRRIRSSDS